MTDVRVPTPPLIVVMGVSASGKSTVAAALADQLGVGWIDADDLHPVENRTKMASGVPLDDEDRWPWLDSVGDALYRAGKDGGAVVACSALRRIYRDRLRATAGRRLVFVHLHGTREILEARAVTRQNHFMPPSLLTSQFTVLEQLQLDEVGMTLDAALPVPDLVATFLDWMGIDAHPKPAASPGISSRSPRHADMAHDVFAATDLDNAM